MFALTTSEVLLSHSVFALTTSEVQLSHSVFALTTSEAQHLNTREICTALSFSYRKQARLDGAANNSLVSHTLLTPAHLLLVAHFVRCLCSNEVHKLNVINQDCIGGGLQVHITHQGRADVKMMG